MTQVHYIARRPQKIGERVFQPGEEIPNAGALPNLRAYLNLGEIEAIPLPGEPHRTAASDGGSPPSHSKQERKAARSA